MDRHAIRRARLIDAGLELLGGAGYAATTVRGVCARAQLTPRYFYESFRDLDELMLAVFDEVAAEAASAVLAASAGAPQDARGKARAAIGAFVELVAEDPRRARILFVEAVGSEPLTRRRFERLRLFADLVAAQGREFYGLREGHDPLMQTTALTLVGGLAEALLAWLDGSLRTTAEQLVEDCAELFVATGEAAVALARSRAPAL
ncbi:MAG TPA: TetR/AcrR family transcriptional regulator [Solirubrobacteraceae bacterium]|nr:TetR/AcrR family transcriptional regulator [Solirubrobacteraceae bacterium]